MRGQNLRHWVLLVSLLLAGPAMATQLSPEESLLEAYRGIGQGGALQQYPFHIDSSEQGDLLSADVFMLLDMRYTQFRGSLQTARNWCDFLILTLNIKSCVNQQQAGRESLLLYAGRKQYQPPEITYQLKYDFILPHNSAHYFEAVMVAEKGPMRTRDYNIRVQATPYSDKTLVRLGMSYNTSIFSRAATYTYLNTLGRNKIGFTVVGRDEKGEPVYTEGMKAVIERNVMRYFLAVSVYLEAMKGTKKLDFRNLLQQWFDATERYHAQLYEYERDTYIKAKLQERLNQQELQQKVDLKAMKRRTRG